MARRAAWCLKPLKRSKLLYIILLMSLSLEFLGTGTSTGVPVIGCDCAVCRSDDPRDKRLRSSALLRGSDGTQQTTVLLDTTPDFRTQMLRSNVRRLDALV